MGKLIELLLTIIIVVIIVTIAQIIILLNYNKIKPFLLKNETNLMKFII